MLKTLIGRVIGTRHERERRRTQPLLDLILQHSERLGDVSEEELRAQTAKFRQAIGERTSALDA